jgi:pyruvate dehydrogenase E2 component (dihydrolipoamide acetyltransferase)
MEEIFVPASGMAMEEVVLAEWLKQPGEKVEPGEAVALVETDKSTVELSGETSGHLSHHLVPAGARVRGGVTVAYVLAAGEADPAAQTGPNAMAAGAGDAGGPTPASAVSPTPAGVGSPAGSPSTSRPDAGPATGSPSEQVAAAFAKDGDGRHLVSPRGRRLATLAAVAAAAVSATGAAASPRVSARNGLGAAGTDGVGVAGEPAPERRATAQLVSESWHTMPHFSVGREVRAEPLLAALSASRAEGIEATATDFLLRAFALALEDAGERADVGLAVATQWGVLIPVVRDVAACSLHELAARRRAAVDRARLRRLSSLDAAPTPFATLSNLGPQGVRWFTGVVPLGQRALLTVGSIGPRPAVEGRGLVVAQMFDAVLTADHRHYDGADSARLLAGFADHLQQAAPAGTAGAGTTSGGGDDRR